MREQEPLSFCGTISVSVGDKEALMRVSARTQSQEGLLISVITARSKTRPSLSSSPQARLAVSS